MSPVPLGKIRVKDSFWAPRQQANKEVTIPYIHDLWERTGRFQSLKRESAPGTAGQPELAYESDVAKWLESASYSLISHPDRELDAMLDQVITLVAQGQSSEAGKAWASQYNSLYSIGHMIEAGIAHYEATSKRSLLDVVCRYADHIDSVFGPQPGKKPGFTGHEEIELALVRLYRATGEKRYLNLAKFFIDERGPHQPILRDYFNGGAKARGDAPDIETQWPFSIGQKYDHLQAHLPVRQQKTAEGHAVMAMYLMCGMADVAAETGDRELFEACKTIWQNVTTRRMYIHGGVGPSCEGERFTIDYDMPNETAYTETCAAIGLVMWANRMLQVELDGRYSDVMERALYNGTISGVSLHGDRFFYANPLAVNPRSAYYKKTAPEINRIRAPKTYMGYVLYEFKKRNRIKTVRQETFDPPCCLPNISRLVASVGQYAYSERRDTVAIHLYFRGDAEAQVADSKVILRQDTDYPWSGHVMISVEPERPVKFSIAVRVPGWCPGAAISVNGEAITSQPRKGYVTIKRTWQPGDRIEIGLQMPVQRIYAHPSVEANAGRVALQRGPLVYCLEEVDNGADLHLLALPRTAALETVLEKDLLGGMVTITSSAARIQSNSWDGRLYRIEPPRTSDTRFKAVPYCVWGNRQPGEMMVWLRET
jgi:hypothetical protein